MCMRSSARTRPSALMHAQRITGRLETQDASTAVNLREMSGPFSGARRCTHAPSGTREFATVRHLPQPGWDRTRDRTGGWPQAVALDPVSQSECAYPYQLSAKPRPVKKGPRAGVNRSKAVPFPRPAFEYVRLDRRDERRCDFYSARHRESRGASVERRPRLPPASLRAGREPIARRRGPRGAGEAPGAIFEELSSAIFAASCHLWSRIGVGGPPPATCSRSRSGSGTKVGRTLASDFLKTREIGKLHCSLAKMICPARASFWVACKLAFSGAWMPSGWPGAGRGRSVGS